MAINPAEAAKMTSDEEAVIERWEQRIDEAIRKGYREGWQPWVDLDNTVTPRVRGVLMERYRQAGWMVEYHDDQRDGASLTFHALNLKEEG